MGGNSVEIEFVEGRPVTPRRGIAWLKIDGNPVVNAKNIFDKLKTSRQQYLRVSFDQWIALKDIPDRYHGWPNEPQFKPCWQFNFRDRTGRNRIYGFKWHPQTPDQDFEVCVMAMHANKNQAETDPFYKRKMIQFVNDSEIQAAIIQQVNRYFLK